MRTIKIWLLTSLLLISIFLLGACAKQKPEDFVGQGSTVPQTQAGDNSASSETAKLIGDDYILGNQNAPVTVIEFGDFECPFCTKVFLETEPKIRQEYINTGKVKWIMRDFISPAHSKGDEAAMAAQCAGLQGKYFEMHDKLFSNSYTGDNWGDDSKIARQSGYDEAKAVELFKNYAKEIGLDANKFNNCLGSRQSENEINKDKSDGQAAGISGTPTFLIGNDKNGFTKLSGSQPFAAFKQIIDAKLG